MNFPTIRRLILAAALLVGLAAAQAAPAEFDSELLAIQQDWATANYQTGSDAKSAAFETLSKRAASFVAKYPQRAEPLIWQGIVLSTQAGVQGGLGALGLAKKSRAALEQALKIDPQALDGSAYTSLGALYSKVPGFPVGFGNDKKARELLRQALSINPDGIDSNYFYGEFLADQDEFTEAAKYLQKALQAPDRPGREVADRGRREEIQALLVRIREHHG